MQLHDPQQKSVFSTLLISTKREGICLPWVNHFEIYFSWENCETHIYSHRTEDLTQNLTEKKLIFWEDGKQSLELIT